MSQQNNAASVATVVESKVDTTKAPEVLAHEAIETVTITVTVNKGVYERVIAHQMRDTLPFVPALKRQVAITNHTNDKIGKYFDSALKGIETSATLKMLKAEHPELFKK